MITLHNKNATLQIHKTNVVNGEWIWNTLSKEETPEESFFPRLCLFSFAKGLWTLLPTIVLLWASDSFLLLSRWRDPSHLASFSNLLVLTKSPSLFFEDAAAIQIVSPQNYVIIPIESWNRKIHKISQKCETIPLTKHNRVPITKHNKDCPQL